VLLVAVEAFLGIAVPDWANTVKHVSKNSAKVP
jgi:hypothetical protein